MKINQFLQRLNPTPPPATSGDLQILEQFTKQYPWCGIGHQLLLEVLQQHDDKRFSFYSAKAAIYAVHRDLLYRRLQHIRQQAAAQTHLNSLDDDLITLDMSESALTPPEPQPQPQPQPAAAPAPAEQAPAVQAHQPAKPAFYNPGDYFGGENYDTEPVSFTDPINRFLVEKPQLRPVASALSEISLPEGLEDREAAPVIIDTRDIDDIVTETLAQIYEDQGFVTLAIAAYEKLSLREPKKSTYFAARIQNLKFKLKS